MHASVYQRNGEITTECASCAAMLIERAVRQNAYEKTEIRWISFGILGIIFGLVFFPLGFIFAALSLYAARKRKAGHTLGIGGVLLSGILMVWWITYNFT
jgi:hypothetical protein